MVAAAREENLWALLIEPQLDTARGLLAAGVTPPFDKDLVMAAIKLMERQAKRTGLDAKPKIESDDWLKERPDVELAELARAYNIDISMMELPELTPIPLRN